MRGVLKSLAWAMVGTLLIAAAPAAAQEATGGLRYSITVTKFENQSGWHGQWDLGHTWDTVLTDMLNQTGRFIVLGESDMRGAALAEQDLGASGRTAGGAKTPVTDGGFRRLLSLLLVLTGDPIPAEAFRMPEVEGVGVVFEKAEGDKCQRCWKILPDVGTHAHAGVCARCDAAVG